MARQRFIKPAFFLHGELYDAEAESGLPLRVAFAGLWTQADRRGVFRCKPRELKAAILPHDPVDMDQVITALESKGFIVTYVVDGKRYGHIPTLPDHQTFHRDEKPSHDPGPDAAQRRHRASTVPAPCQHADPTLPYPTLPNPTPMTVTAGGGTVWTPDQQEAAAGWREGCADGRAFDAVVRQAAEDKMQGGGFGWAVVGQALLEMRGATPPPTFGLLCLLGYCRRVRDRKPESPKASTVTDHLGRIRPAVREGDTWRFTDAEGGTLRV